MTIKELIEKLKEYDKDLILVFAAFVDGDTIEYDLITHYQEGRKYLTLRLKQSPDYDYDS